MFKILFGIESVVVTRGISNIRLNPFLNSLLGQKEASVLCLPNVTLWYVWEP